MESAENSVESDEKDVTFKTLVSIKPFAKVLHYFWQICVNTLQEKILSLYYITY